MKYLYTDEKSGYDVFCSLDPSLCKKATCRNCRHLKRFCGARSWARRYLPPPSCFFPPPVLPFLLRICNTIMHSLILLWNRSPLRISNVRIATLKDQSRNGSVSGPSLPWP